MRSLRRLLVLMAFLAASLHAVVFSDGPPAEDPQVVLEQNRRLVEKRRADPDQFSRLKRDHAAFQALPPERQARLRQLDHDLHAEDPATQARLMAVLERYVAWLEKLDDGDRAWIESAPDAATRLERVKTIRDKQWVKRLPRQVQEDLAKLPADKQPLRIAELRLQERQRRLDWFWTSHGRDGDALKRARPTRISEFPPEVRLYYGVTLSRILSKSELARLHDAEGDWPLYARTLAKTMTTPTPKLPGFPAADKIWATKMQNLPNDWRFALNSYFQADGNLAKGSQKKGLTTEQKQRLGQRRHLNSKADMWPDFAVEAARLVREQKLKVESQLGPSKPQDFWPATKQFIETELVPKLTEAERNELASKEGKWPDYPERLFEFAKHHHLAIPGYARPCPPEFWDAASNMLPDVPDRTLRNFTLTELTPEERGQLKLSLDDATSRERLVALFWARHPDELERQLRPHKTKRP
jgi:hypothetical protein